MLHALRRKQLFEIILPLMKMKKVKDKLPVFC